MSHGRGGIGFFGMLALLFIGLKLIGVIEWEWVWVLAPIWIPLVLTLITVVVVGLGLVVYLGFKKSIR